MRMTFAVAVACLTFGGLAAAVMQQQRFDSPPTFRPKSGAGAENARESV